MKTQQLARPIPTSAIAHRHVKRFQIELATTDVPVRIAAAPERTLPISQHVLRGIDLVGAATLLVLLIVPMALIALAIRLTSGGPIFYRQDRVGRDGQCFSMLKFRTMRIDAEAQTGPVWAKPGDPRRTRIGVLLRRLSLDELPQLINVLRGEMSLVGPRPERPCFVKEFAHTYPLYPRRHSVLPGITGWAQVNGWRGNTPVDTRLQYDLHYIENRSPAFNLWILLVTPFRILVERNAY